MEKCAICNKKVKYPAIALYCRTKNVHLCKKCKEKYNKCEFDIILNK